MLVEGLVIVFFFFSFSLSFFPPTILLFLFVMSFSYLLFFNSHCFSVALWWDIIYLLSCLRISRSGWRQNSFWRKHISRLFEKIEMSVKRKMKEKEFSKFLNMSFSFLSRRFQRDVTERVCLVLKSFVSSVSFLSCLFCFLFRKRENIFLSENSPIKWIFRKCSWIFDLLFFYLSNYLCIAFFSIYKGISPYVCLPSFMSPSHLSSICLPHYVSFLSVA